MNSALPRQVTTPATKARDLKQEKTDFTAEGSPPPGMVGNMPPQTPDAVIPTAPDGDTRKPRPSGPFAETTP